MVTEKAAAAGTERMYEGERIYEGDLVMIVKLAKDSWCNGQLCRVISISEHDATCVVWSAVVNAELRLRMDKVSKVEDGIQARLQAREATTAGGDAPLAEKTTPSSRSAVHTSDTSAGTVDGTERLDSSRRRRQQQQQQQQQRKPQPQSQLPQSQQQQQQRDWFAKFFENVVISWVQQEQLTAFDHHTRPPGQEFPSRQDFYQFLEAEFPENIQRDGGTVIWVDKRVLGPDWLGVFERLAPIASRDNVPLHQITDAPPTPKESEGIDSTNSTPTTDSIPVGGIRERSRPRAPGAIISDSAQAMSNIGSIGSSVVGSEQRGAGRRSMPRSTPRSIQQTKPADSLSTPPGSPSIVTTAVTAEIPTKSPKDGEQPAEVLNIIGNLPTEIMRSRQKLSAPSAPSAAAAPAAVESFLVESSLRPSAPPPAVVPSSVVPFRVRGGLAGEAHLGSPIVYEKKGVENMGNDDDDLNEEDVQAYEVDLDDLSQLDKQLGLGLDLSSVGLSEFEIKEMTQILREMVGTDTSMDTTGERRVMDMEHRELGGGREMPLGRGAVNPTKGSTTSAQAIAIPVFFGEV
jgi:hypothetical protein